MATQYDDVINVESQPASQVASPWSKAGGVVNSLLGAKGSGSSGIASNLIGNTAGNILGKALPAYGAFTGGLDLVKGGSRLGDILSGTKTGASVGTMVM